MSISHEIKSQLAKLLATEDLIVEHRRIETAQFNVQTRVLSLPIWDNASNIVYDMLVGHEVGHALFTPNQDLPTHVPHQFFNIVEDARIEKLMKRKYPGLAKTFYGGYKELSEEDFFCLDGEDISKMNLADRANLFFKIGNYNEIYIQKGKEKEIIDMISDCETFDHVLIAAEELYNFCKSEQNQDKISDAEVSPELEGESNSSDKTQTESEPQIKNSENSEDYTEERNDNSEDAENNDSKSFDTTSNEPEVLTVKNFEESLKDLINEAGIDNVYVEIPQVNLDSIIISNTKIHFEVDSFFNNQLKKYPTIKISYETVDNNFLKFKRSAQKEVNYLVKEFECRKSADSYSRASISNTGVLDTSKLHTYKFNEDLFKKVSIVPDGKNHGLIFVLDWSGSMSTVLQDTCKQLFNLVWFCKKVNIPFEVYAFSNEWHRSAFDHEQRRYVGEDIVPHYEKKKDLLCVHEPFSMLNILSSKISGKKLENQMLNIWRIANYYHCGYACNYDIPDRMSLSGTPLNESIVSLHQIIPKFQKQNKLQKVQCIILTDGEAGHLTRHVEISGMNGKSYIGNRRLNVNTTYLRDRNLKTTYKIEYEYHKFTDVMLKNLKDKFTFLNVIGIRVLSPRDGNSFIRRYYDEFSRDQQKLVSEWKKEKSFCIKDSGYDAYFGISASALSQDSEFEVDDGASKAKIKSAFVKSLKTKKLNKKVLGEFISLVV
jgi:hypothetical protein